MDTTHQILQDNLMCLKEWIQKNSSLQNLQIIENSLVCHLPSGMETIDIRDFPLTSILENELLRDCIYDKNKMNYVDLFRIIRVNVIAANYEVPTNINTNQVYFTNLDMKLDENHHYFLVLQDNLGRIYKIEKNINFILKKYQQLSEEKHLVLLEDLKREMEGI